MVIDDNMSIWIVPCCKTSLDPRAPPFFHWKTCRSIERQAGAAFARSFLIGSSLGYFSDRHQGSAGCFDHLWWVFPASDLPPTTSQAKAGPAICSLIRKQFRDRTKTRKQRANKTREPSICCLNMYKRSWFQVFKHIISHDFVAMHIFLKMRWMLRNVGWRNH